MSSPRQRIQRLKKDIEQLGQQAANNINSKKTLNLPLQIVSIKKSQQREEMQQNFFVFV